MIFMATWLAAAQCGGYKSTSSPFSFHMQSDYFHRLSLDPTISKLVVSNECDSEGEKALGVSIYCTVHGEEKVMKQ